MTDKKINITSTALEKGLDMAKSFLGKLIMPAVEEVGLLAQDRVRLWRFKNQIRMLNKAEEVCRVNKIDPKTISLKVLVPLMEQASLEEDEEMQDRWAVLLSNLVDSEQNIESHVFPYLLGQISKKEYNAIAKSVEIGNKSRRAIIEELQRLDNLNNFFSGSSKKGSENSIHEDQNANPMIFKAPQLEEKFKEPIEFDKNGLEMFEVSNLVRLGVLAPSQQFEVVLRDLRRGQIGQLSQAIDLAETPEDKAFIYFKKKALRRRGLKPQDLSADIFERDQKYTITELGELFIQACTEKRIRIVAIRK